MAPFREAFGRTRTQRFLPPLESPDESLTRLHLESASLLLRTQVAVDDPGTDIQVHAPRRQLAISPYQSRLKHVLFTSGEVRDVITDWSPRSAHGPDSISPIINKRPLFRSAGLRNVHLERGAKTRLFLSLLETQSHCVHAKTK